MEERQVSRRWPAALAALGVLAAVALILGVTAWRLEQPEYHYDVRTDLSIHFTNSDKVIQVLREAMVRRDWRVVIRYTSRRDNMSDLSAVVKDLMNYAMAETDDPTEGDYLRFQTGGYQLNYRYYEEQEGNAYTLEIYPDYYTTAEQEEQVTARVKEILAELDFGPDTAEYEKIRAVHDYVCDHVDYDRIHKKNPYYHLKTTAYAALFHGQAVCQGYSVLTYRLLREAGVDCRIVTGPADNGVWVENHAWNLVAIDGVYYNLDVTWDDLDGTEDYFLKSDADFAPTHTRDDAYTTAEFTAQYPMAAEHYPLP